LSDTTMTDARDDRFVAAFGIGSQYVNSVDRRKPEPQPVFRLAYIARAVTTGERASVVAREIDRHRFRPVRVGLRARDGRYRQSAGYDARRERLPGNRRPPWRAFARLPHAGRLLAHAHAGSGRQPTLPRPSQGVRRQTLRRPCGSRRHRALARRPAISLGRTCRLRRFDADDAGRTPARAAAHSWRRRQTVSDVARPSIGRALFEGRNPLAVSDARTVR